MYVVPRKSLFHFQHLEEMFPPNILGINYKWLFNNIFNKIKYDYVHKQIVLSGIFLKSICAVWLLMTHIDWIELNYHYGDIQIKVAYIYVCVCQSLINTIFLTTVIRLCKIIIDVNYLLIKMLNLRKKLTIIYHT